MYLVWGQAEIGRPAKDDRPPRPNGPHSPASFAEEIAKGRTSENAKKDRENAGYSSLYIGCSCFRFFRDPHVLGRFRKPLVFARLAVVWGQVPFRAMGAVAPMDAPAENLPRPSFFAVRTFVARTYEESPSVVVAWLHDTHRVPLRIPAPFIRLTRHRKGG